jgi:hypothetical protein
MTLETLSKSETARTGDCWPRGESVPVREYFEAHGRALAKKDM